MSPVALPPSLAAAPMALAWAIPPLGGALIGLAAGRIAAAVIGRRASGPGAVRAAAWIIPGLTASLLERPLIALTGSPERVGEAVAKSATVAVRWLVTSPVFLHEVRQTISSLVSSICALPVADVLARGNVRTFFFERILPSLSVEENRRAVTQAVEAAFSVGPGTLVPAEALGSITRALDRLLPVVFERLIEWLESQEMRSTMAARGRELLPRVLEKLNLMQRFLLSAGQFDRRIDEKMPEIVEETLDALERLLREPAQQRSVRDRVILALQDWRSSSQSGDDATLVIRDVVNGYLDRLTDPAVRETLFATLEKLLADGAQSLGSLLRRRFGASEGEIADSIANAVLGWISRPTTAASISTWAAKKASAHVEANADQPAAKIFAINTIGKEKIDSFLIRNAERLASVQGPGIAARVRVSAARWAGVVGLLIGLLVGLVEDVLHLLGIV